MTETSFSFCVTTPHTDLTVTTDGTVALRIEFGKHAERSARDEIEQLVEDQLLEYFGGERKFFTFPYDAKGTELDKTVWTQVLQIQYGHTKTYGEIARAIGKPGASRAVGTANGRNPLPIVVPCHRVVAVGGRLGGFGGGLPLKKRLLDLECSQSPILGPE